jgi:hypothetical protein
MVRPSRLARFSSLANWSGLNTNDTLRGVPDLPTVFGLPAFVFFHVFACPLLNIYI